MERWLPIKIWKDGKYYNFTGLYEVSNEGRVRSVNRLEVDKTGRKRLLKGVIRKQFTDKNGYCLVSLWRKGKGGLFKVHRLVATAFLANPKNMPLINHRDENVSNNRIENLEWCDALYNRNYGNCEKKRAKTFNANMTEERRREYFERAMAQGNLYKPIAIEQIDPMTDAVINEFPSIAEACRVFHSSHIWEAVDGKKRNTACGYKWKTKHNDND